MFRSGSANLFWYGVVITSALVVCTAGVGSRPFWDYDEAIYAQITHDMAASTDPLVTSRWGQPFFEKPPLYFWISMGLDRALSSPEWSYRLPSAFAGVVSVALVVVLVWEAAGTMLGALLAGAILVTTGAFVEAARQMRLDVPTVAMLLLAAVCFERGRRDARWLGGIAVAIALGFMTKMVIALLGVVYILIRAGIEREWSWLRSRYVWWGVLAGICIAAPWHVYMALHYGPAFFDGYFWHNVVDRTGSDVLGGTQTIREFLGYFCAYAAPWSVLFVPGCLVGVWIVRTHHVFHDRSVRAFFAFAATATALLALFLMSRTRIFYYLLPVYPFVAAALGIAGERAMVRFGARAGAAVVTACVAAAWVTWGTAFHQFETFRINDRIVADEARAAAMLAQEHNALPVLAYEYDYWDTIGYYGDHGRIQPMTDDAPLTSPFYLLVSTPYMQWHAFDPLLQAHLTTLYAGEVVTIYRFQP